MKLLRVGSESDWRVRLITREAGKGKEKISVTTPCAANVTLILRCHPQWRGLIAYDEMLGAVVKTGPLPWDPIDCATSIKSREWLDSDTDRLINHLERTEDLTCARASVESGLQVAAEAQMVHPVRAYLDALVWDRVPRLATMASVYFACADSPYARAIMPRWMISACARAREPGCKADLVLLLQGRQGAGKTSGFIELVPDRSWYADSAFSIDSKDAFGAVRGPWLVCLDEFPTNKGTLERWKNFITQTVDRVRLPYGRREQEFPRQCVLMATANPDEVFVDTTGNRRWLVIRIAEGRVVDTLAIRRDRDQLWAEAEHLRRTGHPWWVDSEELRVLCEGEQASAVRTDPWQPVIEEWLARPVSVDAHGARRPLDVSAGILTHEVLLFAVGKRVGDWTRADEMRVADVLRALGYTRGERVRESGRGQVRRYTREER